MAEQAQKQSSHSSQSDSNKKRDWILVAGEIGRFAGKAVLTGFLVGLGGALYQSTARSLFTKSDNVVPLKKVI